MTEEARARLDTMVRTNNGFEIAEADLQIRGPGEFFGTRQSGEMGFHVANPLRDKEFLETARKEAFSLAEDVDRRDELKQTLRTLPSTWQRRYHLARIG
jgi:ATP-dependent DNA helicase RecG